MQESNGIKTQKFLLALKKIRETSGCKSTLTADLILTLLEVGKSEGVSGRDIEKLLGMTASKAARLLDSLRETQSNGANGLGLVIEKPDNNNHRAILRYPNQKLKALLRNLEG